MQFEDLIAAKVRMAQMDATVAIWSGAVLVFLALCLLGYAWHLYMRSDYYGDGASLCLLMAAVVAIFGVPALGHGIYSYKTAEMQAQADLANYQLVELRK